MTIFSGSTEIPEGTSIYSGSTPVRAVYSGATLVWERVITTALVSADSVAQGSDPNTSWGSTTTPRDGDLSTFTEVTGFVVGTVTYETLEFSFPSIAASEILRVRLLIKGQGATHAFNRLRAKNSGGGNAPPVSTSLNLMFFATAGAVSTYDSGLISADDSGSDADKTWNFPASAFVGTSAAVLNWWGNTPRLEVESGDFNGGGTGGRIHEVQLQVEYKPA